MKRRAFAAVLAVSTVVLVGCRGGIDTIRDPGAELGVFFPRMTPADEIPQAVMEGRVILEDGCLWIEEPGVGRYLALWPAGSYPARGTSGIEVRLADGSVMAMQGESVRVVGGELSELAHVRELIGRDPPDACQRGKYWRAFEPLGR